MNDALVQFAPIVLAVWGLAELVGARFKLPKDMIAIVVGPLLAVLSYKVGFLSAAPSLAAAAVVGLVATVSAGIFADYVASPLLKRIKGATSGIHSPKDPST